MFSRGRFIFLTQREIYLQEVTHEVLEAGKPEICREGLQGRDRGRVKGRLLAEFLPARGRSIFCSLQASTSWGEAHLCCEGNLLYWKALDLNVNLI